MIAARAAAFGLLAGFLASAPLWNRQPNKSRPADVSAFSLVVPGFDGADKHINAPVYFFDNAYNPRPPSAFAYHTITASDALYHDYDFPASCGLASDQCDALDWPHATDPAGTMFAQSPNEPPTYRHPPGPPVLSPHYLPPTIPGDMRAMLEGPGILVDANDQEQTYCYSGTPEQCRMRPPRYAHYHAGTTFHAADNFWPMDWWSTP